MGRTLYQSGASRVTVVFLSLLPHFFFFFFLKMAQLDTGVEIRKDDATSLKVHTSVYCHVIML